MLLVLRLIIPTELSLSQVGVHSPTISMAQFGGNLPGRTVRNYSAVDRGKRHYLNHSGGNEHLISSLEVFKRDSVANCLDSQPAGDLQDRNPGNTRQNTGIKVW